MRKFFAFLISFLAFTTSVYAQSIPNAPIAQGQAWTVGQWNSAWQSKQDTLGYTPLNPNNNLSELTSAAAARTALGLGTASTISTGTSGPNIPLLNGNNTWSGTNAFGAISATSITGGDVSGLTVTSSYATAAATLASRSARSISVLDFDSSACSSSSYDSTNAFYNAAAWMLAHGPGVIHVPAGTCIIGNSTHPALNLGHGVSLEGAGAGATVLQAGVANPNPLILMEGAGQVLANVFINCAGVSQPTSGSCVQIGYTGNFFQNQYIMNVIMTNPCIGLDMNGNQIGIFNSYINQTQGAGCGGIRVGNLTTTGLTVDAQIVDTVVASNRSTPADFGLSLYDSGGGYIENADFLYSKVGTQMIPGANQYVEWNVLAHTALGDTNVNYAFYANPTNSGGHILGNRFNSDWAASNSNGDLMLLNNTNGGQFTDMDFTQLYASNTVGNAITIGANVSNVSITGGSKLCAYGLSGVNLQTNAGTLVLNGNTIIPTCMGHNNGGTYGISFGGNNNNLVVTSNNFVGNSTYKPLNGFMDGLNTVIFRDNLPFDNNGPNLTSGAFSGGTLDLSLGNTIGTQFPLFYYSGTSGVTITGFAHPGWQGRSFRIINVSNGSITFGNNSTTTGYYIGSPPKTIVGYDYVDCYFNGVYALCH